MALLAAGALMSLLGGCASDETTPADTAKAAKELNNSKPDQPEYPPPSDLSVAPPAGGTEKK